MSKRKFNSIDESINNGGADCIGSGTYGTVFQPIKCTNLVFKKSNLYKNDTLNDTLNEDIIREICFLSTYNHTHISDLKSIIIKDNKCIFYMKYGGITLLDYFIINRNCNLLFIIYQLLNILNINHKHNIIHGDIKPLNIVVDKSGNATLIDWGSFNVYPKYNEYIVGTKHYEPPETYYSPNPFIDCINDIYRLGISILCLYNFFDDIEEPINYLTMYYKNQEKFPDKFCRLNTNVINNCEIRGIIDKMLVIDYKKRLYASELLKDSVFNKFRNIQIKDLDISEIQHCTSNIESINMCRDSKIFKKSIICETRKILLEWIWDVCIELEHPNLFLHICTLIDIYSSKHKIDIKDYQLIGICMIYISEIYFSSTNYSYTLINLTDNSYNLSQLNKTVLDILKFFDYNIYINTPDLIYNYSIPFKNDSVYIKIRDLILEPESFGIVHMFGKINLVKSDIKK